ncbi:hypothetical protein ACFL27_25825, partial [candidate division CSSED10-310 bacterium]
PRIPHQALIHASLYVMMLLWINPELIFKNCYKSKIFFSLLTLYVNVLLKYSWKLLSLEVVLKCS